MATNSSGAFEVLNEIENGDFNDHEGQFIDCAFVPDADHDDCVQASEDVENDSDEDDIDENDMVGGNYEVVYEQYNEVQSLLEENHTWKWFDGHVNHQFDLENKIFLTEEQKSKIKNMSKSEIFELFFSKEIKLIIIKASKENDLELPVAKLENFVGILLTSIFNSRKSVRDYWSKNDLLSCNRVSSSMSRNNFLNIKTRLKYSEVDEKNTQDKIWRVRKLADTFRKNLQQFGFFLSNMSVDESMIKFYGRSGIKQFMPLKPIRFGLKLWALATSSGFLLDFQIYCGKGGEDHEKLKNCTLGSKVVMRMLHNFFETVPSDRIKDYNVTFDNFFTSPDLLLHLDKIGLKATGTVRQKRVYEIGLEINKKGKEVPKRKAVTVSLDKACERGTWEAKYDYESKLNYISVKDSKIVSLLTTAAGIEPKTPMKRWSAREKKSQYRISLCIYDV